MGRPYLPGRGESQEERLAQINSEWSFKSDKGRALMQLSFHESGIRGHGWFEQKFASLFDDGRVGEYGPTEKLTFDDLKEKVQLAKVAESRKVLFNGRDNGGRWLFVWPTVAEVEHAMRNAMQIIVNRQAIFGRGKR